MLLQELEGGSRVGRFLNFFSMVSFSNNACVGADGLNGTCYTEQANDMLIWRAEQGIHNIASLVLMRGLILC